LPAQHDIAAETELWDIFAASAFKEDAERSFCWTQYAGHGPGPELLGDPAPRGGDRLRHEPRPRPHREYLRFADQVQMLGRMPGMTIAGDQAAMAVA
jgi:hypothetical protein